jgi:hypothetical protein
VEHYISLALVLTIYRLWSQFGSGHSDTKLPIQVVYLRYQSGVEGGRSRPQIFHNVH